jgi:hypothetical protein
MTKNQKALVSFGVSSDKYLNYATNNLYCEREWQAVVEEMMGAFKKGTKEY